MVKPPIRLHTKQIASSRKERCFFPLHGYSLFCQLRWTFLRSYPLRLSMVISFYFLFYLSSIYEVCIQFFQLDETTNNSAMHGIYYTIHTFKYMCSWETTPCVIYVNVNFTVYDVNPVGLSLDQHNRGGDLEYLEKRNPSTNTKTERGCLAENLYIINSLGMLLRSPFLLVRIFSHP